MRPLLLTSMNGLSDVQVSPGGGFVDSVMESPTDSDTNFLSSENAWVGTLSNRRLRPPQDAIMSASAAPTMQFRTGLHRMRLRSGKASTTVDLWVNRYSLYAS